MSAYTDAYYRDLANDVLTRVRNPSICQGWTCPREYFAGAVEEKNGRKYQIKCFVVNKDKRTRDGQPMNIVHMKVRFRGDRNYTFLFIGFAENFKERLVEVVRLPCSSPAL